MKKSFEEIKGAIQDVYEGGKGIVIPMVVAEITFVGILGKGTYELIETIRTYIGSLLH